MSEQQLAVPLETREAKQIGINFPERTIELVVMPYEQETVVEYRGRAVREIVSRGAFDGIHADQRRVRVNRDHDARRTCGKAMSFDADREEGLVAEIWIAETELGDETLRLADGGMLDASAAFRPKWNKRSNKLDEEWPTRDLRRLNKIWLGHIALTPDPAYESAQVLAVRQAGAERLAAPAGTPTPNLDQVRDWLQADRYARLGREL